MSQPNTTSLTDTAPVDTGPVDSSTTDSTTTDSGTTDTTAAALALRYIAAVNAGDTEALDELLAADFTDHHLPPAVERGVAGAKSWVRLLHDALELHVEALEVIDGGDLVAVRARITGRHVGEFAGTPPTGRHFDATYLSIERVEHGRIIERWEIADQATIAAQLAGENPAA